MDTQAIGKANNDTVLFLFKSSTATEQVVCSKHRVPKRITRYNLTFLSFIVSRPNLVSNVESNVLDMTNLRCEIERELSMVAQRAGLGGNKRQWRQYFDKLGPFP